MANEKNEKKAAKKVETIELPVLRGEDGQTDVEAMLAKAEEIVRAYNEQDANATASVSEVVEEILANPRYVKHKTFSASTLAKLSLGILGELPTDKVEAQYAARIRAYMLGKKDEVISIAAGRNAGFWIRSRLSNDEIAKLLKSEE